MSSKQQNPVMPAGYDDESSPYFVPEHLRELWLDPVTQGFLPKVDFGSDIRSRAAEEAITHVMKAAGDDAPEFPPFRFHDPEAFNKQRRYDDWMAEHRDDIGNLRIQLITNDTAGLAARAMHERRLEYVQDRYERAVTAAERAAEQVRLATCPVCGQHDSALNGAVTNRLILPGLSLFPETPAERRITSCASCHTVATAMLADALAAASVGPKGETREALVARELGWVRVNGKAVAS